MTATFNGRLDRAASFTQIVLGLAVFSSVSSMKIVGAAVAIISVWVFVYQPGRKALLASQQQRRYEALCIKMARLSDDELAEEYVRLGERNSEVMEFICMAAENAEHINHKSNPPHKLGPLHRALLLIAGS